MGKCTTCSSCAKQYKVGKTRKKMSNYKGIGKARRISARREYDAGAPIGTRYKTPRGFKVLSLDKNGRPFLSASKEKRRRAFSGKKRK